jgi:drug/metabolite transporter (DMT)-like permease
MSWQLLTAISVLSLSISVLLQRVLIHKDKTNPYAYAVVFQGIVGVILLVFALLDGIKLPNIENLIVPAIISVIFFGAGHVVYAKTLQKVEASVFSVLFASQAIWIMLLGIIFFNESLTILQIFGSLLIFAGVLLLVKNLRSIFKDKGTLLGLATGFLFGIAITAWSYVGRHTDALSWAAISFVGTSLFIFLIYPKSVLYMKPLLKPQTLKRLLLLGVFYAVGSVTMLLAYKAGTFALVSPLRQTSIIVTVLLALSFLPQERNHVKRKIFAAIICAMGVVLIVV